MHHVDSLTSYSFLVQLVENSPGTRYLGLLLTSVSLHSHSCWNTCVISLLALRYCVKGSHLSNNSSGYGGESSAGNVWWHKESHSKEEPSKNFRMLDFVRHMASVHSDTERHLIPFDIRWKAQSIFQTHPISRRDKVTSFLGRTESYLLYFLNLEYQAYIIIIWTVQQCSDKRLWKLSFPCCLSLVIIAWSHFLGNTVLFSFQDKDSNPVNLPKQAIPQNSLFRKEIHVEIS